VPTPTGLPKTGEVWERTWRQPPDWQPQSMRFVVLNRGKGDYWSLRVAISQGPGKPYLREHWVDPAYAFSRNQLKYIGPAGPETKKRLGLG
jgi:hypothetical protein